MNSINNMKYILDNQEHIIGRLEIYNIPINANNDFDFICNLGYNSNSFTLSNDVNIISRNIFNRFQFIRNILKNIVSDEYAYIDSDPYIEYLNNIKNISILLIGKNNELPHYESIIIYIFEK